MSHIGLKAKYQPRKGKNHFYAKLPRSYRTAKRFLKKFTNRKVRHEMKLQNGGDYKRLGDLMFNKAFE